MALFWCDLTFLVPFDVCLALKGVLCFHVGVGQVHCCRVFDPTKDPTRIVNMKKCLNTNEATILTEVNDAISSQNSYRTINRSPFNHTSNIMSITHRRQSSSQSDNQNPKATKRADLIHKHHQLNFQTIEGKTHKRRGNTFHHSYEVFL